MSVVGDTGIVATDGGNALVGQPLGSKRGVKGDGNAIELALDPPFGDTFKDADGDNCSTTGGPFAGFGWYIAFSGGISASFAGGLYEGTGP
jgi:hypothetical protein